MRKMSLALVVIAASGCSTAPLGNQFTVPVQGGQAMSCVAQQMANRQYQTVSGGANGGMIRAERMNDEPFWLNVIGINDSVDVLDATLQGSQLLVVAFSQVLRGEERRSAAPSDEARRDAQAVLAACEAD